MNPLGLLRAPKREGLSTKQEVQTQAVVVKREPMVLGIKTEPKFQLNPPTTFVKLEPVAIKNKTELTNGFKRTYSRRDTDEESFRANRPKSNGFFFRRRRRKLTPEAQRKQDFAIAKKLHMRLTAKDHDSLSGKELDSLAWAESILVKEAFRRNLEEAASESIAAQEELDYGTAPKRPRLTELVETAETSAICTDEPVMILDTLQLAVVDFGKPGGRYTFDQYKQIETALGKQVVNHIQENPCSVPPTYGATSYHDGVCVLDCKDEMSYNFAKTAINQLKPWKKAHLRAVPPEKSPFKSMGRLYVPNLGMDKNQILQVLRSQNPSINMNKWEFIEEEVTRSNSKWYTLLIDDPPIKLLESKQIRLFFGIGEVTLRLLGCSGPGEF